MNKIKTIIAKVKCCFAAVVSRIVVHRWPFTSWWHVSFIPSKQGSSNRGYITLFLLHRRICIMIDKSAYKEWAKPNEYSERCFIIAPFGNM